MDTSHFGSDKREDGILRAAAESLALIPEVKSGIMENPDWHLNSLNGIGRAGLNSAFDRGLPISQLYLVDPLCLLLLYL